MTAAHDFDVTATEARRRWHGIARSGADTVAVARASYAAGGKARHRFHAVAWLIFDARASTEARAFAVELLDDRSRKVASKGAATLAWALDRAHLPAMRTAAARRTDGAKADILAAVAAVEAGNPDLWLDRKGGGNLHWTVVEDLWRAMREGGEIRPARAEDVETLSAIAREAYAPYVALIGREPPPMRQDFAADVASGACWAAGARRPYGYVVAREKAGDWLLENLAVAPAEERAGLGRALIRFAEEEGQRRGFRRIVLYTHAKMTRNRDMYLRLGYRETERRTDDGMDRLFFEKAL